MSDLNANVHALQEIIKIIAEEFKDGVPLEAKDDLRTLIEGLIELKALQVYRDNFEFLKGLEKL